MKFYRKKLNSVEELKRETIRLNYRKKQISAEELMPKIPFLGGKSDGEGGSNKGSGILNLALGLINAKGPLQMVLAAVGPVMTMIGNRKKKVTPETKKLSLPGRLVKEIAVGYLVGKGIQLALKGIGKYLKSRRQTKAIEKAEANLQQAAARKAKAL